MNKELHDALSRIDDAVLNIDIKVKAINDKLDELIAALHNYDDGLEMFDDEPKRTSPCVGHDAASWEQEDELNKRMDVIGQNGNEGLHYESMEELNDEFFGKIIDDGFDDYGKRVQKSWMEVYRDDYDKLLKSGMMFEFHPTWTGEWEKDKFAFTHEHKYSNKNKVGGKDNNNTQDNKRVGGNKNKYYRKPNTPVTPKKMSVVEHEKFRSPHKH